MDAVRPYQGLECARCGLYLPGPVSLHGTVLCGYCRRDAFAFESARGFGWYEKPLRDLIHLLKYDGFRPLAKPLGKHLAALAGALAEQPFDLVVPVPLHSNRQRQRGFNQSLLLATQVSKVLGVPVARKDCVRVRDTRPQTGLRASERRKNVAGAFDVPRPQSVKGRRVLLIDDVVTTGATVHACARALRQAGAAGVWVAALARAHHRSLNVL